MSVYLKWQVRPANNEVIGAIGLRGIEQPAEAAGAELDAERRLLDLNLAARFELGAGRSDADAVGGDETGRAGIPTEEAVLLGES